MRVFAWRGSGVRALVAGVVLTSIIALACSHESGGDLKRVMRGTGGHADGVDLDLESSHKYHPGTLSSVGSVAGTIHLDGPALRDTQAITVDPAVCGNVAPTGVDTSASGLGDVLVWIKDAQGGKQFPIDKRVELTSEGCVLQPRVQGAIVGTTVNVLNDDKTLHDLVFINTSTGDTLERMPFFNEGQVVASEKLAKEPGIVEVRCTRHPWTRAWIAVFDHPYFAVTSPDGQFRIDSLPAGQHTVQVWHEGMKEPESRTVQVTPTGARLDLGVRLH